jgi:hypothetical protein
MSQLWDDVVRQAASDDENNAVLAQVVIALDPFMAKYNELLTTDPERSAIYGRQLFDGLAMVYERLVCNSPVGVRDAMRDRFSRTRSAVRAAWRLAEHECVQ